MKRSNANLITLNVVFVVCLIVANVVTSKVLDTGIHIGGVPVLIPGAALTYALTFLYAASSGASHSAQYALAAMFKAAADGKLDFVGHTREYAHRAHRVKELFERHGFHIVYDKDQDEHVSDGFFFTVGYGSMPSSDLVAALLRYGICAISLTSTGSLQNGVRVCVSQMNREEQYDLLDRRLRDFAQDYARK